MLEQVKVYTPDSSLSSPGRMLAEMLRDLYRGREMAWRLAVRDIQAQYRQTFLGLLWAVITPLATTITWVFLSSSGIVSVGATALPYPVYVFTGTLLWSVFTDAMNLPLQQTSSARGMLAKLDFAREAVLVAGLYKLAFNSTIKIVLMLGALLLVDIKPGWSILLFPVGVASLMLVGRAVGLLMTPVGMLYTDVGRLAPLALGFLMYLTPAIYPVPKEGWVRTVFLLNPLTPLIASGRDWLTGFAPVMLTYFVGVNFAAIGGLLFGWAAWRLAMPIIIERM